MLFAFVCESAGLLGVDRAAARVRQAGVLRSAGEHRPLVAAHEQLGRHHAAARAQATRRQERQVRQGRVGARARTAAQPVEETQPGAWMGGCTAAAAMSRMYRSFVYMSHSDYFFLVFSFGSKI